MKFSKLLVSLSLALGFVAAASAQTTMRISISVAQNSHQGIAIDTFAKEVEKRTAGRYKIQTFYSGALGGERESRKLATIPSTLNMAPTGIAT